MTETVLELASLLAIEPDKPSKDNSQPEAIHFTEEEGSPVEEEYAALRQKVQELEQALNRAIVEV